MRDLALPAFEMDCRDWLVLTPSDAGLPDEVGGAPLLAVLSTVVIEDDVFVPASGVLSIGLLDDAVAARPLTAGSVAEELLEPGAPDSLRYVLPAPSGELALLAEFSLPEHRGPEVARRVEALMASFRWAV